MTAYFMVCLASHIVQAFKVLIFRDLSICHRSEGVFQALPNVVIGRDWAQEHEGEEPFASMPDPAQRAAFVKELHLLKTDIFMRMVESGMMPLRPGVQRLVGTARLLSKVFFWHLETVPMTVTGELVSVICMPGQAARGGICLSWHPQGAVHVC